MVRRKRFSEFVFELFNDDVECKIWELFLHKVNDKSYVEFKESLTRPKQTEEVDKDDLKATIQSSREILKGFRPPDR